MNSEPGDPFGIPPALDGERLMVNGVNCYVTGRGPPLILVHSVNPAASAAEVRPIFEHYRASRTVFAIDLTDRPYMPRVMTDSLHTLVASVRKRLGNLPVDAVACSLGSEFLARAAVEAPDLWGRLAFVSPTGFAGTKSRRGSPGSTGAKPWLRALLSSGPWSEALYRALTRPAVIRYYLERTWDSKAIDEVLWAYAVRTAATPFNQREPMRVEEHVQHGQWAINARSIRSVCSRTYTRMASQRYTAGRIGSPHLS